MLAFPLVALCLQIGPPGTTEIYSESDPSVGTYYSASPAVAMGADDLVVQERGYFVGKWPFLQDQHITRTSRRDPNGQVVWSESELITESGELSSLGSYGAETVGLDTALDLVITAVAAKGAMQVRARRYSTGALLWSFNEDLGPTLPPEALSAFRLNEVVIAPSGQRAYLSAIQGGESSETATVRAYDLNAGALAWIANLPNTEVDPDDQLSSLDIEVAPSGSDLLVARRVASGTFGGPTSTEVQALGASNGQPLWTRSFANSVGAALARHPAEDRVGVALRAQAGSRVLELDGTDGSTRWEAALSETDFTGSSDIEYHADGARLAAGFGSTDFAKEGDTFGVAVECFDTTNGAPLWQAKDAFPLVQAFAGVPSLCELSGAGADSLLILYRLNAAPNYMVRRLARHSWNGGTLLDSTLTANAVLVGADAADQPVLLETVSAYSTPDQFLHVRLSSDLAAEVLSDELELQAPTPNRTLTAVLDSAQDRLFRIRLEQAEDNQLHPVLACHDPEDGTGLWLQDLAEMQGASSLVATTVMAQLAVSPDGAQVYSAVFSSEGGFGFDRVRITAFDTATGASLWGGLVQAVNGDFFLNGEFDGPLSGRSYLECLDDQVFLAYRSEVIHGRAWVRCFDSHSGAIQWTNEFDVPLDSLWAATAPWISAADDRLYCLQGIDAGAGAQRWGVSCLDPESGAQVGQFVFPPSTDLGGMLAKPEGVAVTLRLYTGPEFPSYGPDQVWVLDSGLIGIADLVEVPGPILMRLRDLEGFLVLGTDRTLQIGDVPDGWDPDPENDNWVQEGTVCQIYRTAVVEDGDTILAFGQTQAGLLPVTAYDAETGAALWSSAQFSPQLDVDWLTPVGTRENEFLGFLDGLDTTDSSVLGGSYTTQLKNVELPQLISDSSSVALSTGGQVAFQARFARPEAPATGEAYFILGGSGVPGPPTFVDGIALPFASSDPFLLSTYTAANTAAFQSTLGTLDGVGNTSDPRLVVPAGLDPALSGSTFEFAALRFGLAPAIQLLEVSHTLPIQLN